MPVQVVTTAVSKARAKVRGLLHEFTRFGVIGSVAFVVDLTLFNLLRYGLDGEGVLHHKPLTARVLSVAVATVIAYVGNRHWTWRHRPRRALHREYSLFFTFNVIGLLVNVGVLAFVNYVLNLADPVSNNVANIVGIGVGSLFRFWAYRRFVFPPAAPALGDEQPVPLTRVA